MGHPMTEPAEAAVRVVTFERRLDAFLGRYVGRVAAALLAVTAVLTAVFLTDYISYRRKVTREAKTAVSELTVRAAAQIDGVVSRIMTDATALADALSRQELDDDDVARRLTAALDTDPRLFGMGVLYKPYAYQSDRRLHAPYVTREGGEARLGLLQDLYDYTDGRYEFYSVPIERGATWVGPVYGRASRTLIATYSVPFTRMTAAGVKETRGVVMSALALDDLRRVVEGLDLGPSGFGAITSQTGAYLYHPNNEYVLSKKTLADVARERNDKSRLVVAEEVRRGGRGILDHRSTTTGLQAWLLYEPIPSAGWSMQNTFIVDDIPIDVVVLRRKFIRIVCAVVLLLISLIATVVRVQRGEQPRLWLAAGSASVLLLAGVGAVWQAALWFDPSKETAGIPVSDKATLQRVMDRYVADSAERHTPAPVFIPTGIFIETARFVDPTELMVTGYVWQKYDGASAKLRQSFAFADASDVTIDEVYRERQAGVEVVRWRFQATIHQTMNYPAYPLDHERLAITLVHKDLNHNVVLVPDLAAYKILSPTARPGLAEKFGLPGWNLVKSLFALQPRNIQTDFGLHETVVKEAFPLLSYNIVIRRNMLDAFISNLSPMIIGIIILFALQMVVTSDERIASFMQTTAGRVVNICVAMFFVIVFSHIDLRRRIIAQEIFYLEYFYFITYGMILWVALNSILFTKVKGFLFIQYRENLVPKLLFWPVIGGGLFLVTV